MEADDIARIRSIPLADVLIALGAERDPKDPTRNWRYGASRITVTEARFYDHNDAGAAHRLRSGNAGGGGAIDLVQYLKDVDFGGAVRELQGLTDSTPKSARCEANPPRVAPKDQRPSPTPAAENTERVQLYLERTRAIPQATVRAALQSGEVFADAKGNVVFRLKDEAGRPVGYEVRGTRDTPYHSVHGAKGLFITKSDATRSAAFVESGIEALSYQALRGRGLVISTTGNAIDLPARVARALQGRGYSIAAAFNADTAGDRMSEALRYAVGAEVRRERPVEANGAKDWNDQLRMASRSRVNEEVAALSR